MYPVILHDNRFEDGTPQASATAVGFDARHISDRRPFTFWQGDAAGTFYLSVDCAAIKAADAIGLVGHNLGSGGASVSVESSATGAWAGEQVERLAAFSPGDDNALLKTFASAADRYWRLKIVSPTIAPQLAVATLGARLSFPQPPDTPYVPYTETVKETSALSKTGLPLGTVISYKELSIRARFKHIDRNWVMNNYLPFWNTHASLRRFFFYAWDLDAFAADVFFVKHSGRYATPLSVASLVDSLDLQLLGVR